MIHPHKLLHRPLVLPAVERGRHKRAGPKSKRRRGNVLVLPVARTDAPTNQPTNQPNNRKDHHSQLYEPLVVCVDFFATFLRLFCVCACVRANYAEFGCQGREKKGEGGKKRGAASAIGAPV